jgi:hypothetical protein
MKATCLCVSRALITPARQLIASYKSVLIAFVIMAGLLPQQLLAQDIANSVIFNSGDSSHLSRTPTAEGNRKTWTWSGWVKRGNLAASNFQHIFVSDKGTNPDRLYWGRSDAYPDALIVSFSDTYSLVSSAVYRDPAQWIHITLAVDTTQSISSNRVKLFVDGVQVTEFTNSTYPPQDFSTQVNYTQAHYIGSRISSDYFNGYLTNVHFVDGQALAPSFFGGLDATTGKWVPKSYTGTYGTNGFHLDFSDGADLGKDVSENNNNWAVSNLDAADQVIDTPTNNFVVMTALNKSPGLSADNFSNGNLKVSSSGVGQVWYGAGSTHGIDSGKWYYEVDVSGFATYSSGIVGWVLSTIQMDNDISDSINTDIAGFYFRNDSSEGIKYRGFGANGNIQASDASNGSFMLAIDLDNNKLYLGKNGTWFNSANPSAGIGGYPINAPIEAIMPFVAPARSDVSGLTHLLNFGANAQSGFAYDADAGGYFKYTPPTGFKALSSKNIPDTYRQYDDSVLYMDGDGVDASTSFTDEAKHHHAITVNGDAQVDTAQSKFGGGSMYFDGDGYYLTIPDSDDWDFGSGDFTIDFWVRLSSTDTKHNIIGQGGSEVTRWSAYFSPTWGLNFFAQSGGTPFIQMYEPNADGWSANTWYHIAIVRNGNSFTAYKDGVAVASTTDTDSMPNHSTALNIGRGFDGNHYNLNGYIDDLLITKGRALWTSDFTPPVSAHTTYAEQNKIANPADYFDVVTYNGNGSTQDITGLNFSPSLVWLKERNSSSNHSIFDSVRGVQKELNSNATVAEGTTTNGIEAFNTDGFTVGSNGDMNGSSDEYVAWNWKEDPAAGFDIVSYTGDGVSGKQIAHDLGVKPELIIVKNRDRAENWPVYHVSTGAANPGFLDNSNSFASALQYAETEPNAATFTVGSDNALNADGENHIAYLFTSKPGFSKIGSYTGNGSADGPFVYTGFKPRYVMIKVTTNTNDWYIADTERNSYNLVDNALYADTTAADASGNEIDILSNGFKMRSANNANNTNGETYIYYAIAETSIATTAPPKDETPPQLSEIYAVPAMTADTTPAYSFNTNEAGTLQIGGSCSSDATNAVQGDNTITLTLAEGTYSDCTVSVTDAAGNVSEPLAISEFTIDPDYVYEITNAIKFDSGNGEYMSWTPTQDGNLTTWSWSAWVQRGEIGGVKTLLYVDGDSQAAYIRFNQANELEIALGDGSLHNYQSDAFSSSGDWIHLALSVDTTQANAVDRIKLHINGQLTSPKKGYIDPIQNAATLVNSANTHYLGSGAGSDYYDGTMAEVRLVDGAALDANAFGKVTAQGEWVPVEYTSGGGSNSSYLNFGSSTDLGADSVNDNNWQVVRLDSTSQVAPTTNSTSYGFTYADADEIAISTTITEVMTYATDNAYSVDECVIHVADQFTSICPSNQSFVIKQDTNIGRLMCSVALAAFTSNREVKISSDNDICSPNQGAPYAKLISIIK